MTGDLDERAERLGRQLRALRRIIAFAEESQGSWARTTAPDWILNLTTVRSIATAKAVSNLLVTEQVGPAQMLCRPLFEDTVVVHWLLMQEDPTWLVKRFFDHADNSLLRDFDHFKDVLGLQRKDDPTLDQALRRRHRLGTAGTFGDPFWWAAERTASGKVERRPVHWVVQQLQTHAPYAPRLYGGEEPALRTAYALSTRWANEHLHHSARGLPALLARDGRIWWADLTGQSLLVLFNAYWSLGQTIYMQLTYGATNNDFARKRAFDELYVSTLGEAIGLTLDEVREALAEARRETAEDGGPIEF